MTPNKRILIVDDNLSIHEDFQKALRPRSQPASHDRLVELEQMLFSGPVNFQKPHNQLTYILETATQGEEGIDMVQKALARGDPYAMVFVDVRMPPGLDGVQTASKMLEVDPDLEIVLCSAFSDYSWERIVEILGETDRVLFLHKPFDVVEVKQMALALTRKWLLNRENQETQIFLRKAREEAEAVSREKSLFLSNMSHEIRTPLNGVIGMASLLSKTKLNGEQAEYVSDISYSAEVLLDLISDILDFSKIEAGKLTIENIDFDIKGLLEDVRGIFAFQFKDAGLSLTCSCAPDIPKFLCGDPIRIRQILFNLMSNGLKFTETGGVHVQLEAEAEEGEAERGFHIRFSVIDTGIGISKKGIQSLFKSFSQVDPSTSRKYGGTGLGLSISLCLAEKMGGTIEVESSLGEGTKFWFTLRLGPAESEAPLAHNHELEGLRVVVLEKENATNGTLSSLLENWGCHFHTTTHVEAVLAHLNEKAGSEEATQVFLMDHECPVFERDPLFLGLAENPKLADLFKIKVVDKPTPGDAHLIRHQGFAGFLTKPVDEEELYRLLSLCINGEGHGHELMLVPPEQVRILVAEDNLVNQKVVIRMLKVGGYRSDVVKNGQGVLESLAKHHYDLILMDCQMPDMDGFEASRRVRASNAGAWAADLPIVAVTANAVKGDREKCMKAGMNDYITKPIHQDELLKTVATWLARSQRAKIRRS